MPVGAILHVTNAILNYIKKHARENLLIVNVMKLMKIHGNKKKLHPPNSMGINQIEN